MRKPEPKYGWHGHTTPTIATMNGCQVGDRVYHMRSPGKYGTITDGPILRNPSHMPPYYVWLIKWDATGREIHHTVETIAKVV